MQLIIEERSESGREKIKIGMLEQELTIEMKKLKV